MVCTYSVYNCVVLRSDGGHTEGWQSVQGIKSSGGHNASDVVYSGGHGAEVQYL